MVQLTTLKVEKVFYCSVQMRHFSFRSFVTIHSRHSRRRRQTDDIIIMKIAANFTMELQRSADEVTNYSRQMDNELQMKQMTMWKRSIEANDHPSVTLCPWPVSRVCLCNQPLMADVTYRGVPTHRTTDSRSAASTVSAAGT